jgi:carbohydrate-selective porin OprB
MNHASFRVTLLPTIVAIVISFSNHIQGESILAPLNGDAIAIESLLITDYSINTRGGQSTNGSAFRSLFTVDFYFDLSQLIGLENSELFFQYMNQNGEDGSEDVGDIQAYSNIDADGRSQVPQIWIKTTIVKDKLDVKIGKADANYDFAYADNAGEFSNSSAGFSPTIFMLPSFPDPSSAIILFYQPTSNVYLNTGLYDGSYHEGIPTGSRGFKTALNSPADLFGVIEGGYTFGTDELPARVAVGLWHHSGEFEAFNKDKQQGTEGIYFILDKAITIEQDDQMTSCFFQFGFADKDVSEITHHLGAGIQRVGFVDGRDEDIVGLMASYVKLSQEDGAGFADEFELAIEGFYKSQLNDTIAIKPGIQYIINPGGSGNSDSIVCTLRADFTF